MTTKSTIFGFYDGTSDILADNHAYATCTEENSITYEPSTESRKCVGSGIDGGGKPSITGSEVGGGLTLGANYEDIGLALSMVLGFPASVANGAVFDHTFDTTKIDIPYMWFQHQRVDGADTLNEEYSALRADTLELKIEADGLNSPTLDIKGGTYKNDLLGDIFNINDKSNLHQLGVNDMPYVQGKVQIEIAGVMTDSCWLSSFTIKIENGIDSKKLLCDKKSNNVTKRDVTGSFEGEFTKEAYQAIFSKDNSKSVKAVITFVSGDNTMVITMEEITFNFKSEPVKYGEMMLVQGDWSASKKVDATEKMKIVLTNGIADYNL